MMKAYLERFLSNGGPIPLPPEIMNGKASLKTQIKGDVLHYGINLRHLISTGIVLDIDKTSNPYKAGLRDGDIMGSLNINNDGMITIIVKTGNIGGKSDGSGANQENGEQSGGNKDDGKVTDQLKTIKFNALTKDNIPQYAIDE